MYVCLAASIFPDTVLANSCTLLFVSWPEWIQYINSGIYFFKKKTRLIFLPSEIAPMVFSLGNFCGKIFVPSSKYLLLDSLRWACSQFIVIPVFFENSIAVEFCRLISSLICLSLFTIISHPLTSLYILIWNRLTRCPFVYIISVAKNLISFSIVATICVYWGEYNQSVSLIPVFWQLDCVW